MRVMVEGNWVSDVPKEESADKLGSRVGYDR